MLKKTIKFKNLEGHPVTRDFYFHLSMAEVVGGHIRNMNLDDDGQVDVDGFQQQLQSIINAKSGRVIMDTFEDIIRMAYGEKDEDGITFNKSPELSRKFMNTDAYSVLFMEIVTNAGAAAEFVNGITPADMKKLQAESTAVDTSRMTFPQEPAAPRTALGLPVEKKPEDMSKEELLEALKAR